MIFLAIAISNRPFRVPNIARYLMRRFSPSHLASVPAVSRGYFWARWRARPFVQRFYLGNSELLAAKGPSPNHALAMGQPWGGFGPHYAQYASSIMWSCAGRPGDAR